MSIFSAGLIILAVVTAGLCVWAWLTGCPGPARLPQHARWTTEGETTRLADQGDAQCLAEIEWPEWPGGPHGWREPE